MKQKISMFRNVWFGFSLITSINQQTFTGLVQARHVSPTPADLGGVTSFLYELELSCKCSFIVWTDYNRSWYKYQILWYSKALWYTALRGADFDGTRFCIWAKNFWDTLILLLFFEVHGFMLKGADLWFWIYLHQIQNQSVHKAHLKVYT